MQVGLEAAGDFRVGQSVGLDEGVVERKRQPRRTFARGGRIGASPPSNPSVRPRMWLPGGDGTAVSGKSLGVGGFRVVAQAEGVAGFTVTQGLGDQAQQVGLALAQLDDFTARFCSRCIRRTAMAGRRGEPP
jgi:hypothetical protein